MKNWQGTVQKGLNIGNTIGFPTANLKQIPSEAQLKPGVYLGQCKIITDTNHQSLRQSHNCLIFFGPRLVLNEVKNVFEVFILDFSADIYGEKIEVGIKDYIRSPIKFDSVKELKEQLEKDLKIAKSMIKKNHNSL